MNAIAPRKARGRPRKMEPDLGEVRVDAMLRNWAAWARGPAATTGYQEGAAGVTRFNPDEDKARLVEGILVEMKAKRFGFWRVVQFVYVYRFTDDTSAQALKCSLWEFRARVRSAWAWVDSRL